MPGSAADAEDVLQETWLRWAQVDLAQALDHRAFLVRITTRQALDRLRAMKRRKEWYVCPWLPELLVTSPDAAQAAELAESVPMAMMLARRSPSPPQGGLPERDPGGSGGCDAPIRAYEVILVAEAGNRTVLVQGDAFRLVRGFSGDCMNNMLG
jgi:hypothetical protein